MDEMDAESETSLSLPAALEAWGTPEFDEVLSDEMQQQGSDLPLSPAMDNGGWWENDSVEVSVGNFEDAGETIDGEVTVFFEETHLSSCANINRTDTYRATLSVSLDKATGNAEVTYQGASNTTHDDDDEGDEVDVGDMDFDERADHDYGRSEF